MTHDQIGHIEGYILAGIGIIAAIYFIPKNAKGVYRLFVKIGGELGSPTLGQLVGTFFAIGSIYFTIVLTFMGVLMLGFLFGVVTGIR
jgi:hypothetical protein